MLNTKAQVLRSTPRAGPRSAHLCDPPRALSDTLNTVPAETCPRTRAGSGDSVLSHQVCETISPQLGLQICCGAHASL